MPQLSNRTGVQRKPLRRRLPYACRLLVSLLALAPACSVEQANWREPLAGDSGSGDSSAKPASVSAEGQGDASMTTSGESDNGKSNVEQQVDGGNGAKDDDSADDDSVSNDAGGADDDSADDDSVSNDDDSADDDSADDDSADDDSADDDETPELCELDDQRSCWEADNGDALPEQPTTIEGDCRLGVTTCDADGRWGACTGAVAPVASDSCATIGADDNCNGTPNEGCACIGNESQLCGDCGTQLCNPLTGAWGECAPTDSPPAPRCSSDNVAIEVCDASGLWSATRCVPDDNCNAECVEGDSGPTCESSAKDADGDGFGSAACAADPGDDCNDAVFGINPGASESCDGVDNDCNELIDDDARDMLTYYYDADGDLHAPIWSSSVVACEPPSTAPDECTNEQTNCPAGAWTTAALPANDCDDTSATRYAGAPELCNLIDDDCSNTTDSAAEPLEDADGDGFTSDDYSLCSGGYPRTDCDDNNADVRPSQTRRFEDGYCDAATPHWCFSEGQCAAIGTCDDSIGQVWAAGSLDYNCDGNEEALTLTLTEEIAASEACGAAPTSTCEASGAPTYVVGSSPNCGGLSQHTGCVLDGSSCAYETSFQRTLCR